MIEVRGGSQAYVACLCAIKEIRRGFSQTFKVDHTMIFDAGNSEDEVYGHCLKIARKAYPSSDGWDKHEVFLKRIDGIDWVGRHDIDKVVPVSV